MMKQYRHRDYSIDLLKFICAILVVFLHSHWKYENVLLPFTRCAVPCFLMMSGYLLYNDRVDIVKDRTIHNFKKVLKITIYATFLFFIWTELTYIASCKTLFIPTIHQILEWLVFNACPFGHHLWYLYAYLYVLLIVWYFVSKQKLYILLNITPLLLILDVLLGKYGLLIFNIDLPVIVLRNFIFVGIPYFCLGIVLKKIKPRLAINRYLLLGG